jgi:hypothetical protein
MADALFDLDPGQIRTPTPVEQMSPGGRRTLRQAQAAAVGRHPLGLALDRPLTLHPEAAPAGDRQAPGRRCGNCRFRQIFRYHKKPYPKCAHPGSYSAEQYERLGPPRATHGAGTDVRAWWPGCTDHEPGDSAVPDGMRWTPDTGAIR